jgi:hypothetical protein
MLAMSYLGCLLPKLKLKLKAQPQKTFQRNWTIAIDLFSISWNSRGAHDGQVGPSILEGDYGTELKRVDPFSAVPPPSWMFIPFCHASRRYSLSLSWSLERTTTYPLRRPGRDPHPELPCRRAPRRDWKDWTHRIRAHEHNRHGIRTWDMG